MKFLLVFAVVMVGFWFWRANRKPPAPPSGKPGKPPEVPQLEMVRCAVCGLHLPKDDAVTTARAAYCSAEHRQQAER